MDDNKYKIFSIYENGESKYNARVPEEVLNNTTRKKYETKRKKQPLPGELVVRALPYMVGLSLAVSGAYGIATAWQNAQEEKAAALLEMNNEPKPYKLFVPETLKDRRDKEENLICEWDNYIKYTIQYAKDLNIPDDHTILSEINEEFKIIEEYQPKAIASKNFVNTEKRYEMENLKDMYKVILPKCSIILGQTFEEYQAELASKNGFTK